MKDLRSFTVSPYGTGDEVHYLRVGEGPVVVFIHGIGGTGRRWAQLVSLVERDCTVIAPNLFGNGNSTMGGDYSLGNHASRIRDLLDLLGVREATLVGHSFGGGVAMQLAYLWPERCERLVLVSSGGFGREVGPILRALTLPGAERVLQLASAPWLLRHGGRLLGRRSPDLQKLLRGYVSLGNVEARRAWLATLRTVVDRGGQKVSALERLPSLVGIPTLLVWGARDRVIPVAHGETAQRRLPGSRLEVFDTASHAPHLSDPLRFAGLLREFAAATPVGERVDRRQAGRLQVALP